MAVKVIMPQMGESIFEGTLTKWLKKVGEPVVREEPLFEISTDKVDSEIPSPASGILSEILVPEGKTIQIHTVLAIISEAGTEEKASAVSDLNMDIAGQQIPADEAMPDSSKAPPETEKPQALPDAITKRPTPSETVAAIRVQDIRTSPLVRRLARENNIDLSAIQGTGLEGRITKEDVLVYLARLSLSEVPPMPPRQETAHPLESGSSEPESRMPVAAVVVPAPEASSIPEDTTNVTPRFPGEAEIVAMTPMRKAIAEHMVLSKRTSAHVNTVFEVDMSAIVHLRDSYKAEFQRREGVPLTYTPFFAKALADAVREFPIINSSVSGESIVYKKAINLGIAVALDTGLIVPVVRDAHLKSLTGLALAIHDLAERARTKKLRPDDVQNGTISMTNHGKFGALFATPIISQPQVAILGIGGIEKRPVIIHDAIAIRSMVCLSLTFDHRVIDGAVADQFMARLKERLQSWIQWID